MECERMGSAILAFYHVTSPEDWTSLWPMARSFNLSISKLCSFEMRIQDSSALRNFPFYCT